MKLVDSSFRGVIQVYENNKVVFEHVNGFSDLPNKVVNTNNTRFASASAGKAFVAVAIMQLVESGRLRLESTLEEILKDIDFKGIDTGITVSQLLNHTSGIPDYFNEEILDEYEELWIDTPNYSIRSNEDLLPLFINMDMMYDKGTRFQYNNSGYVVLAMIIEEISGLKFDEFLKKNIFDVCEMTDTGYFELDQLPDRCSNNYIYLSNSDSYKTNIYSVDAKGTGAGGAFITVSDIHKFWNCFMSGNLVSKETVTEMITVKSVSDSGGCYGYGFWLSKAKNGSIIPAFQGSDPGVSFYTEYNTETNIISILVSNYGDNVWKEMKNIRESKYMR